MEVEGRSRHALELVLPMIPTPISGKSGGIGKRSGKIVGSVSPGSDTTVSATLDTSLSVSGKPGKLNKSQLI